VFDHFPKAKDMEKAFAAMRQSANEDERARQRTNIAGQLKKMGNAYQPELPELLNICQAEAGVMTDVHLEKAVHICEVAFHGHRKNEQHPNLVVLLQVAVNALTFIGLLLRHGLSRHEVTSVELHNRFFHFAHAALACRQQLGDRVPKGMHEKVSATIALYLMLERLDLFAMKPETQKTLIRTLIPIMQECEVYFIPANLQLEAIKGFWIDQEDKHSPARSLLHGSLAGVSPHDRLAVNIMPLVMRLEQSSETKLTSLRSKIPEDVKALIRRKIKAMERRMKRAEVHENVRLLVQWMDVVDLRPDRGVNAVLLDADEFGFRLFVDDREALLPDVDSFLAVNRSGQGIMRGVLVWKKIEAKGVVLGGAWIKESFQQAQLSLLGHSEMAVGVREWHALIRRMDDKRIVCWLGERELQPGISILLPIGNKKYSSTLEQVDHRGGNYCRGVLVIGKEWKEVNFELEG